MKTKHTQHIRLRGVRQNNLKGFDIDLPLGRLIVVTGLSGTGKSSLVFETLHAEGQRRYVETFSPYVRQFLEMLDQPRVGGIENIRPSIAIQQGNTVKTSRSTIGTMTELCDFFKVWFCHLAELFDPVTGEKIDDDNPQSIWKKVLARFEGRIVLPAFSVHLPDNFSLEDIIKSLRGQGYTRVITHAGIQKLDAIELGVLKELKNLYVVQDRLKMQPDASSRFIEAVQTALHFGQGELSLFSTNGNLLARYSEGLNSTATGVRFRRPTPALFSFNSPLGACPECRGFGRIIEIDYRLVIPDHSLSLRDGAIRAFAGNVYSESRRDLLKACKRVGIPADIPFRDLTEEQTAFVIDGEQGYGEDGKEWPESWYGVKRFFNWLGSNTYKMHIRVFLSKYRAYVTCPNCSGMRLQPEALNWKWRGLPLPKLYKLPVSALLSLLQKYHKPTGHPQVDIAAESILTRLKYLEQVGLGYLTLDRASRTLSGGEVERVNLTSCLGTSLVDTLFVLDEPSIGLHSRDIDRLIEILKNLTTRGNTVVVVEHDEAIMRAADHIIELGPRPGSGGGNLTFSGNLTALLNKKDSLTGAYLTGRKSILVPARRLVRSGKNGRKSAEPETSHLAFHKASKHNIRNLSFKIPLQRLVCISGVSGSGKSTLLDNIVCQGLLAKMGNPVEDPARIEGIDLQFKLNEVVLVDQSPISRTPRSNSVLYTGAWEHIRILYADADGAAASGLTASHFSFNSGGGRCEQCRGLGYERIEMQFMADVYVTCPVCDGRRFKPEVLAITLRCRSIADLLKMNVSEAVDFFDDEPKIRNRLATLREVGLGYLPLGQPLNTLSGGESQRLKLVKYLCRIGGSAGPSLLLLDEPTTGLHRDDVKQLIGVMQRLVELGHSLVVIEHHLDILKSADWVLEMGPDAGVKGGKIVFAGTPEGLAAKNTPSSAFMAEALSNGKKNREGKSAGPSHFQKSSALVPFPAQPALMAAEPPSSFTTNGPDCLELTGARENNLKNLSLRIPLGQISVITGVSGSGKSSLAFDIIFAEGQRRFMESMSPWARQFAEQLPKPDIDSLKNIPPTVAIQQRVTHGTGKSTVATITEVAQYLRLLYARIGLQHSPVTGEPLAAMKPAELLKRLQKILTANDKKRTGLLYLCAPLVRGRKGHHQPLADWALKQGFKLLRVDGAYVKPERFQKLDRYREHDIEAVVAQFNPRTAVHQATGADLKTALDLGKGSCFLAAKSGKILSWFSTSRTDPVTGESYPELDPKHFSWNSPKGWCPTCRGHGRIYEWMAGNEDFPENIEEMEHGSSCPDCRGERLNPLSRAVKLYRPDGVTLSLPQLLCLSPDKLLETMRDLQLDRRARAILAEVLPEIEERLRFLKRVGLDYLTLDRATATLSGGEAQRIRLAAQLGSNLSGVLYVLDEPSIGLHAQDHARLMRTLERLRAKGNSLLIVEHDEETMRRADRIIDLGPGAGVHGGELLANCPLSQLLKNKNSLTGRYLKKGLKHPLRGSYRPLPEPFNPHRRSRNGQNSSWLRVGKTALRNLKGDDLLLPLSRLIMVCGLSGAGKSTLIRDLLKPAADYASRNNIPRLHWRNFPDRNLMNGGNGAPPAFRQVVNAHTFRHVIEVDQSPIGKTPRSTPATYIGAFDHIRRFFQTLPEARIHGYSAGTFSFNTKGGRCEKCKGAGRIKLAMSFMPDTYITCEECDGRRYSAELDEIRWKGKNITEVLAMTFAEAAEFFAFHGRLKAILELMVETGLGYLTLGQSSPTLSGGEAQRLKLVSELAKGLQSVMERALGISPKNLYLLEEPTIGLHLSDCEKLIELLHRLVDRGHTVIVIEHHLDLIAEADYVVEIGPEGGDRGGEILYQGPVRGLLHCKHSPTAPYLKSKLPPEQPQHQINYFGGAFNVVPRTPS